MFECLTLAEIKQTLKLGAHTHGLLRRYTPARGMPGVVNAWDELQISTHQSITQDFVRFDLQDHFHFMTELLVTC